MDIVRLYLTMVLPAPFGCNLKCPFCAIAERKEAIKNELGPNAYCCFLSEVAARLDVSRFAIQGYEPLLPEAWPLAKDLLRIADVFNLGTALVTNGTLLSDKAEELSGLVDVLTVSVDSFDSRRHDKLRGVEGAWRKTIEGVRAAVPHFKEDLQVASVLFPGKVSYLDQMPQLLQELGVTEWVIAPLVDFTTGAFKDNREKVREALLYLDERARGKGVHVYLSDEFRRMTSDELFQEMNVKSLEETNYIIRLSPDGTCSRGTEALREASEVPTWDPYNNPEDPVEFVNRILAEVGKELQARQ